MSTSSASGTKSDFTQKLLSDLRLRKQRMASASQNSSHYSSRIMPPADASHGRTTRQTQPGTTTSTDRRSSLSNMNSRTGNSHKSTTTSSTRTQPLLMNQEATTATNHHHHQMIVGKSHHHQRTLDLSMTLSCALDSNGNLSKKITTNATAIVGFLHQLSKNATDLSPSSSSALTISTTAAVGSRGGSSNSKQYWPSTTQFPTLTTLHLNEISKGAQKLNRILKAFSRINNNNNNNHLNNNDSSVEIGRELLKGAMDLEESLRMLVSLQEASECMIMSSNSPHKKSNTSSNSQVKLHLMSQDDDEETETKSSTETKTKASDELLRVERPVFSFDKATNKHNSHRRSASLGADMNHSLAAAAAPSVPSSTSSSSSQYSVPTQSSKVDGPRISNVVAKLMGLEEAAPNKQNLPTPSISSSPDQTQYTTVDGKRFINRISTSSESTSNRDDHVPAVIVSNSSKQQKVVTSEKIVILTPNKSRADEIYNAASGGSSFYYGDRKTERILTERPDLDDDILRHYKKLCDSSTPYEEVQSYSGPTQHSKKGSSGDGGKKASFIVDKSNGGDDVHQKKDQVVAVTTTQAKGENVKRTISKGGDQMHKPITVHQNSELTKRVIQGKKNAASSKLTSSNQPAGVVGRSVGSDEERFDRPKTPQRHDHLGGNKHKLADQRSQKRVGRSNSRTSPLVRKSKESRVSENPPKDIHEVGIPTQVKGESMTSNTEFRNTETMSSQLPSNSEKQQDVLTREENSVNPEESVKIENTVVSQYQGRSNAALQQKEDIKSTITRETKTFAGKVVGKSEITRKANEKIVVKSRDKHVPKNLKVVKQQQMSLRQEIKLRAVEKISSSSKGEPRARGSKSKSREVVEACSDQQQKDNTKDIMVVKELLCLEQNGNPAWSVNNVDNPDSNASPRHQKSQQAMGECIDKELQLHTASDIIGGDGKVILPTKLETLQPKALTEEEIHLKQILITSHLFLNTAEALFKLNIPIGILNYTSDHIHSKEENHENKLLIDCSYELLKRKGSKQEEPMFLPCSKSRAVSRPKPRCLDDLVRDICRDFETLKEYGIIEEKQGSSQPCSEAEYLLKMVERDVGFGNADVNSMWEMGWNDRIFGYVEVEEVVLDVEKGLINRLVEEALEGLLGVEYDGFMDQVRTETVSLIQAAH